jgi:hypothetical protein
MLESKDCDMSNNIFNPYLGNIGSSDDDYDEEQDKNQKHQIKINLRMIIFSIMSLIPNSCR